MKLQTHCHDCSQPLTVALPDTTTDGDAEFIGQRVFCLPCVLRRMSPVQRHVEVKNELVTKTVSATN
jgi:hypothetical protein